jgi:hypothetical protein
MVAKVHHAVPQPPGAQREPDVRVAGQSQARLAEDVNGLLRRLAAGTSDPLVRDWAAKLLASDGLAPHRGVS